MGRQVTGAGVFAALWLTVLPGASGTVVPRKKPIRQHWRRGDSGGDGHAGRIDIL